MNNGNPPSKPQNTSAPDETAIEDVRLMLLVKEGDIKAFESLVEKHQSAIIGTVAKMTGNISDAHDISQQVFVRVWKSAARYEPTAKFTTWLFTITRNLVFNESRRRYRQLETSIEEREDITHTEIPDETPNRPDQAALQQELEDAIDQAIQELPEKQRLAVIMRRFENLPYEEIGDVLELSLPAVKSLLFRARGQLKEQLQKYLDPAS